MDRKEFFEESGFGGRVEETIEKTLKKHGTSLKL